MSETNQSSSFGGGRFPRAVKVCHEVLASRIAEGDVVVDATAGNGHDTLALAKLVGDSGRVVAIDIQQAAVDATRMRCAEHGVDGRVELHCGSHDGLAEILDGREVSAVVFNLGYLPGGDKEVITHSDSTMVALEAALAALKVGGVLVVVCYPGHDGGRQEAEVVERWAAELDERMYLAVSYRMMNQRKRPPFVVAVEKRATDGRG
ncbi:class I SAM-dependent methyltransferase [Sulfuriroseicoccus oceanibius]|uniref:Class I SAM-dependent methyltransferase n=1 Tax=Sulfuriroseicoccus oceanibius TaxID=2707525 RepID=A0A6B3LD16_9BACT|nr:class I SAM-dependent methyltransferase [Sulfuriroseicoccus oceanibius]QQL44832.1 class I SAM-dependent methyltransferase [Sulfuriroseicoccus oceanibius]